MTQFFNVQMNLQDSPKVQVEQSASKSSSSESDPAETFDSVLQKNLTDKNSKTSSNETTSQSQQPTELKNTRGNAHDVMDPDTENIENPVETEALIASASSEIPIENELFNSTDNLKATPEAQQTYSEVLNASAIATPKGKENSAIISAISNAANDQVSFASGTRTLSDLQSQASGSINPFSKTLTDSPINVQAAQATSTSAIPQNELLLDRLQSIINSGAETGVLSIKNINTLENNSPLRSQSVQFISSSDADNLVQNNLASGTTAKNFTLLEEGVFAPSLRSQQKMDGIRHDSNQQFFDAKTQPQLNLSQGATSGNSAQGDGLGQPGSGLGQMSTLSAPQETTGAFSLSTATSSDPLATQIATSTKSIMLPSGTVVYDQDVIQQLVERFQVSQRQLDSKIQMKLHPVELGEMEIDLTVKEGSIRANVVAQSQHVQEILERNLAKLKAVLEQQGFTVEEITVTNQSEMVGEFDLFDQQLSNSDSSYFENNKENSEDQTPFILDELQRPLLDTSYGVNVKA